MVIESRNQNSPIKHSPINNDSQITDPHSSILNAPFSSLEYDSETRGAAYHPLIRLIYLGTSDTFRSTYALGPMFWAGWHDSGQVLVHARQHHTETRGAAIDHGGQRMVRSAGSAGHRTRAQQLGSGCAWRTWRRSRVVDRRRQRRESNGEHRAPTLAPCDGVSRRCGARSTPAAHGIERTGHRCQCSEVAR